MKLKESETLELKKSTSELKEGIISIAAILNKHGRGKVYFGVKNDGTAIGQQVSEKTLRGVSHAISEGIEPKIYPKVGKTLIEGRDCISVSFSGEHRPYFASGRAHMRVGDEDRQLSAAELERLILHKNRGKMQWDSEPSGYGIGKIDEKTLKAYVKRANLAGRVGFEFDNAKSILKKLGLARDGRLLRAAEVLFCNENPLEVQAAVFAGVDKVTFLDIKQFKGSIFSLLEASEGYISQRINWRAEIGKLQRSEIPEIPIKSLREALVNSFCHRDYYAPESNKIAIYKDRVEIYNPGRFPEGLTPQDYISGGGQSVLRNPLIADILYKSKDIEKWGSGLKRIYEECRENGVKVEFLDIKTGFMVVFRRPEGFAKAAPQVTPQVTPQVALTGLERRIADEIRKDAKISRRELSEKLKIGQDTVKEYLEKLRAKGVIRRIGRTSGGYWKVKA